MTISYETLKNTIIFYTNFYDVPLSGYVCIKGKIMKFENTKFPYWENFDENDDTGENDVYIEGEWMLSETKYLTYLFRKIRYGYFLAICNGSYYECGDMFLTFCKTKVRNAIPEYIRDFLLDIFYRKYNTNVQNAFKVKTTNPII